MKPSETAVIPADQQLRPKMFRQNTMAFPQGLREAIPTMSGCWGRALALARIDGDCCNSALFGQQVRIRFQVEETGKLTGKFDVQACLNLEEARALAKTLLELADQAERMPQTIP